MRTLAYVFALLTAACAREAAGPANPPATVLGQSVTYRFPLPDGSSVGSREMAGRYTILLFLTTYDTASQAVARRLDELVHTHKPRINGLAIALEPPQNATLVAVYRQAMTLAYDVALADQDTLDGRGPFGDIRAVPALVLLDRESRVLRRGFGVEALLDVQSGLPRAE
ncbi:MAG TPA: TlpA family protein disulfide reductase [Polyangiaceae bacterium]|nr:TlpA family protein disulfide reductase [Polyangiaceae bacterium]